MRLPWKPKYLLVNGCPAPYEVAAQIHVVCETARQRPVAIYRGRDAEPLLHRHGKHSQYELYHATPSQRRAWGVEGQPNRPGQSQHELRSDGRANRGPIGRRLWKWQVGVDSGANSRQAKEEIDHAARTHGWEVEHPYRAGIEGHHWCFKKKPRARSLGQARRLAKIRKQLPRR